MHYYMAILVVLVSDAPAKCEWGAPEIVFVLDDGEDSSVADTATLYVGYDYSGGPVTAWLELSDGEEISWTF